MIAWDPGAAVAGLAIGAIVAGCYFAGLALGMRGALRSARPLVLLAASSAARIAVLLAIGWIVADRGGVSAFLGYAAAFVAVREISLMLARRGARGARAQ